MFEVDRFKLNDTTNMVTRIHKQIFFLPLRLDLSRRFLWIVCQNIICFAFSFIFMCLCARI